MKETAGSPDEPDTKDEHDPKRGHGERKAVPLEAAAQDRIGEKLREVYSDVMNEPVPDRFLELLNKLDEKSSGSSGSEQG